MYVSPLLFYNRLRTGFLLLSTIFQRTGDVLVLRCCFIVKPYPTLCDSLDSSPPGCSVHGISQARILDWVAISSSKESSQTGDLTHVSCICRCILYNCTANTVIVPKFCLFLFCNFLSYSIISHRPASNHKSNEEFTVFMAVQQVMVCLYYWHFDGLSYPLSLSCCYTKATQYVKIVKFKLWF